MENDRSFNLIGAFALFVSDSMAQVTASRAPESGVAASAIALIGHEPGISIRVLATGTGLSHAGAVRLVDRLVADGIAERHSRAGDKRERSLHLTAAGETVCADILKARSAILRRGLGVLNEDELLVLSDLCELVLRAGIQSEGDAYRTCRLCDYRACTDCPVDDELSQHGSGV